jgi:predicted kinase
VRSDVLRKRLAQCLPETRLPASAYTREASAAVYAELMRGTGAALASGQAAVADAVFASEEKRDAICAVGSPQAVPFQGIWLNCEEDQRVQRVEARRADASDADGNVARAQSALPGPRREDWVRLNANGCREDVLRAACELLQKRQMLA